MELLVHSLGGGPEQEIVVKERVHCPGIDCSTGAVSRANPAAKRKGTGVICGQFVLWLYKAQSAKPINMHVFSLEPCKSFMTRELKMIRRYCLSWDRTPGFPFQAHTL